MAMASPSIIDRVRAFIDPVKVAEEISSNKSTLYRDSYMEPYNPDDLVAKKGLEIYQKMLRDDQVKACIALKKNATISSGWKICPAADDDPKAAEHAAFVEHVFTDGMGGSFRKVLLDMLSAFPYGFSITEKVFGVYDRGDFAGKVGLKALKVRPPYGWDIKTDDGGNLTKLVQHAQRKDLTFEGDRLNYFAIYSYNGSWGNFFGESDLRAAYRPWWSKDVTYRFMNIFNERFGMGIMVGKYPPGAGKEAKDALDEMIKNISAKTAFRIPNTFDVDILESSTRSQSIFLPTIEHCNKCIARAILLPDKLGFTDSPGGSYNLGENQFDLFMTVLDNIRTDFAETVIDEQIIRDLVDKNYPGVTKYPYFEFEPLTKEDRKKLSEQFVVAVDKGVVLATEEDEAHTRDITGYPKRTQESVLLPKPTPPPSPFGGGIGQPGGGNLPPGGAGQPRTDEERLIAHFGKAKAAQMIKELGLQGAIKELPPRGSRLPGQPPADDDEDEDDEDRKLREFRSSGFYRQPNKYEENIDLKGTKTALDEFEFNNGLEMGRLITRMRDDIIDTISRKKIIEDKDFGEVDKLQLKYVGDLKLFFGDMLRRGYNLGRRHGKDAILAKKRTYAAKVFKPVLSILPPKEAMAFFEAKRFYLAGTERDFILKNIKALVYDGIKTGKASRDVTYNLEEFFSQYKVEQLTSTRELAPVDEIPGRIETIIRTNTNDAYNQGRIAMFRDPSVADFVPAYEYSAILDDRVTDLCAKLDGKVYKANNPIWNEITPPNHYNCRSTIIPILGDEQWEESNKVKIELPEGFGK